MSTEVAYARIPGDLKAAVEAHAEQHALSQTAAIVALLERGLEAGSLERRARKLDEQLATVRVELQSASSTIAAMEQREQSLRVTYDALVARLEQPLATCPKCSQQVRGYDLLATGHCRHCQAPLASLLMPTAAKSGLNQQELLLLLGALGILLTVAYVQSKSR